MKQRLHISIPFGDIILPVVHCDDGHKRVPLKRICDMIGVNWKTQVAKFKDESYLNRRFGTGYHPLKGGELSPKGGNPTHLCIRIDRVTAFLNTLNPAKIRGMGNDEAADWLESKHQEWDDALHAYETSIDGIFGNSQAADVKHLSELYKLRKLAPSLQEKAAIQRMINKCFGGMGHDLKSIQNPQDELPLQDAG